VFKIIKNLQQKPEHVRKLTAFSIAIFITTIIAVVWISTLDQRFDTSQQEIVPTSTQDNLTPLTLIKDQFKQLYSTFSE